MSGKKISIGAKPTASGADRAAEKWVEDRAPGKNAGETKRLTIDVPVDLHGRIKAACALKGVKMVDDINRLLVQEYGNN